MKVIILVLTLGFCNNLLAAEKFGLKLTLGMELNLAEVSKNTFKEVSQKPINEYLLKYDNGIEVITIKPPVENTDVIVEDVPEENNIEVLWNLSEKGKLIYMAVVDGETKTREVPAKVKFSSNGLVESFVVLNSAPTSEEMGADIRMKEIVSGVTDIEKFKVKTKVSSKPMTCVRVAKTLECSSSFSLIAKGVLK